MIFCICLNIPESKIKELRSQGLSWEEIKKTLGIGADCGICLNQEIEEELSEEAIS